MIRTIQNSFVAGEIAPALHGRHDLRPYFHGAQFVSNFCVRKAGGLRKRLGTDIALDLTGHEAGRILPFFYDRTRSTLLLLSDGLARVIERQPSGALGFTQADGADYTVAIPWPDDVLPSIRHYQLGDTLYLSAPGYQAARLVRYAADSWALSYLTGVTEIETVAGAESTVPSFALNVNVSAPL